MPWSYLPWCCLLTLDGSTHEVRKSKKTKNCRGLCVSVLISPNLARPESRTAPQGRILALAFTVASSFSSTAFGASHHLVGSMDGQPDAASSSSSDEIPSLAASDGSDSPGPANEPDASGGARQGALPTDPSETTGTTTKANDASARDDLPCTCCA